MNPASAPIAVSLGDPAGIGPELIAEIWSQRGSLGLSPFAVVGGAGVLASAARTRGLAIEIAPVSDLVEAAAVFDRALPVLGGEDAPHRPGTPDEAGARLALHSLETATNLALTGAAGALVTMPVSNCLLYTSDAADE